MGIERVLQAVSLLRGHKAHAARNTAQRWSLNSEVLKSQTFRTEMLLTDASRVPLERVERAQQLLDGMAVDDLRRASCGAAALYDWAVGIIEWRMHGPPDERQELSVGSLHQRSCRTIA